MSVRFGTGNLQSSHIGCQQVCLRRRRLAQRGGKGHKLHTKSCTIVDEGADGPIYRRCREGRSVSSKTPALMFMGTGSNVGKSTVVAGLCRALRRRGYAVLPFKPQNMSNNAAATPEGGEIGRAQALQARAAGVAPSIHMNPVLIKPESETGAQLIVQGKRFGTLAASDYGKRQALLMEAVMDSYRILQSRAEIILIEGAGSPAEINLRAGDIANMGFAVAANVPVIMIGDIDRGGVIASLVGTHAVLPAEERALVKGFLINKFRGDMRLFDNGLTAIEERTGWPSFGVLPWFKDAHLLPAEDALDLRSRSRDRSRLTIAVPILAHIANFDDVDPLAQEEGVDLRFIPPGEPLPAQAKLVILPGSKATIADLAFFRAQGWEIDLAAHMRRGGRVLGLCGGYQMLGRRIHDPEGIEGAAGSADGLGFLDIETTLSRTKTVRPANAVHLASGLPLKGYEIHLGQSAGADCARPLIKIEGIADGAVSADGRVSGCYLHGLFAEDAFRHHYLQGFGADGGLAYESAIEAALDALAAHCEAYLDIDTLLRVDRAAGLSGRIENNHARAGKEEADL